MEPTVTPDPQAAETFLRALYGDELPPGSSIVLSTADHQCAWVATVELAAKVATANDHGYFNVGLQDWGRASRIPRRDDKTRSQRNTRGSAASASAIPGCFADVDIGNKDNGMTYPPDVESAMGVLEGLPLPPTVVVHSGGGLHVYWLFQELLTLSSDEERELAAHVLRQWQAFVRAALRQQGWGMDSTGDLARELRVPGTVHAKHGRLVQVIQNDGSRYDISEFEEWIPPAEGEPSRPKQPRRGDLSPEEVARIQAALEFVDPCPRETWFQIGAALHWTGAGEQAFDIWDQWSRRCKDKYDPQDQRRTWESLDENKDKSITLGTLFFLAKQGGWRDTLDNLHLNSAYSAYSAGESAWQKPTPLTAAADLPPFPIETAFSPALAKLRTLVEAIATAYQVPVDLPAMLALPVAGLALSKKLEVEPQPGWRENLALWSLVLLPSGDRKSPVLSTLVGPIYAWMRGKGDQMREQIAIHVSRIDVARQRLKNAQRAAAGGKAQEGQVRPSAPTNVDALARELEALENGAPIPPSLIATEATTEAMAGMLVQNQERGLVAAAEADALDVIMGRYCSGVPNFGVWCSGYTGEPVEVRRRSREPDRMQRPALNVALAVQPESIKGVFSSRQARGRGFVARMLSSHPVSRVGYRELQPPPISRELVAWWANTLRRLLDVEVPDHPAVIGLSPKAQCLFQGYRAEHELKMRPEGEFGSSHEWAAKLPGQLLRIAGVLHGLSGPTIEPEIGADTMAAVLSWEPYLVAHESFVVALAGQDPAVEIAQRILDWIPRDQTMRDEAGDGTFSRRDAFNGVRGPAQIRQVEDIDPALDLLQEHNWIRPLPPPERPGPGRKPSPRFAVHADAIRGRQPSPQITQNTQNCPADLDSADCADSAGDMEVQKPPSEDEGEVF